MRKRYWAAWEKSKGQDGVDIGANFGEEERYDIDLA